MELKFYRCEKCGKVIVSAEELSLNGWKRIEACVTEAAREKHIPVVAASGNTVVVSVGSVTHPMSEEHLIEWVAAETEKGYAVQYFSAADKPEATFLLADGDRLKAVYAYCNLHGLWKAQ